VEDLDHQELNKDIVKFIINIDNEHQLFYFKSLVNEINNKENFNVFSPYFNGNILVLFLSLKENKLMGDLHNFSINLFLKIQKSKLEQIINKDREILAKYISVNHTKFIKKTNGSFIKMIIDNGNIEIDGDRYEIL
jgi:hypothetical protein